MNPIVKEHVALIMAGGQGTRFWPMSSEKRPKQFLAITSDKPLILETFERLRRIVSPEHIFIVADGRYADQISQALPDFPLANLIAEPQPRNTAPCLIYANIFLSRRYENANLVVVPADHHIPDSDSFARQMKDALDYADQRCVITAGIKPLYAHTGYGYIEADESLGDSHGLTRFQPVRTFHEKPDHQRALTYINSGRHYWNGGMFIYNIHHFRDFIREYAPEYFQHMRTIEQCWEDAQEVKTAFGLFKAEAIDRVLMEKMTEARMFKADFAWNDVGSWSSIYELADKDGDGNCRRGEGLLVNAHKSMIVNELHIPLALVGVDGLSVVATADGILVTRTDRAQEVKEVPGRLEKGVARWPKPNPE